MTREKSITAPVNGNVSNRGIFDIIANDDFAKGNKKPLIIK